MKSSSKYPVSVVLITKNEKHNLNECLKSVSWAEEIIVIDSGSIDGSQAICQNFGCKLIETDWPGHGPQKNRGVHLAKQPWIFSIDADERVSEELMLEIHEAIKSSEACAYYIPRVSSYCGRFMKFSGWYPDHVLRLFRRGYGQFNDHKAHPKLIINGVCKYLSHPLIHYAINDLDQVLGKINHYSSLGAEQLYSEGKKATLLKAIGKGVWSFLRTYFFRLGFLDKKEGLMLAISNAEGTYYKYAKLAFLCQQLDSEDL